MESATEIFKSIQERVGNYRYSLLNIVIFFSTLALEEIFRVAIFECSCKDNDFYFSAFFFSPALVLFLLGLMVQTKVWKHFQGYKSRGNKLTNQCCPDFCEILFRATISPAAWFFFALVDGTYVVCYESNKRQNISYAISSVPTETLGSIITEAPGLVNCLEDLTKEEEDHFKAKSRGIAAWYAAGVILLAFVFLTIKYCCGTRMTYEQGKFVHFYRIKEAEHLKEGLQRKADAIAKLTVQEFLENPLPFQEDFSKESREVWEKISMISKGNDIAEILIEEKKKDTKNTEDTENTKYTKDTNMYSHLHLLMSSLKREQQQEDLIT